MFEVGLDLSSYKISAVEFYKNRSEIMLKNAGIIDIESHAIAGGELVDSIVLINGLKELWKNFKFQKKEVNLGLSGIKLIVKEIELPVTEEKDIEKAIKYQISDYIPISKDNLTFDFYVIEKKATSSKVMIIGAKKHMVDNFVEAVQAAGLKINSVDLNCFAFYRAVNFLYNFKNLSPQETRGSFCLVYFGEEVSIIEFTDASEVRYPRFINSSLTSFAETLNKKFNLPDAELIRKIREFDFGTLLYKEIKKKKIEKKVSGAENTFLSENNINAETKNGTESDEELKKIIEEKINMSLNQLRSEDKDSEEKFDNVEDEILTDVSGSLKVSANQLVNEIIRSKDHFLQENRNFKIKKILISGENLINLDRYIEKNVKIPVERIDVSKTIDVDALKKTSLFKPEGMNDFSGRLIISAGLALRGIK